jgi:hypothetical protein
MGARVKCPSKTLINDVFLGDANKWQNKNKT